MAHDPSRGGLQLAAFIEKRDGSIPKFCERTGLGRVQVQRLVNGERGHSISAAMALAIERATNGDVPVEAWDTPDDAPDDASFSPTGTEA